MLKKTILLILLGYWSVNLSAATLTYYTEKEIGDREYGALKAPFITRKTIKYCKRHFFVGRVIQLLTLKLIPLKKPKASLKKFSTVMTLALLSLN